MRAARMVARAVSPTSAATSTRFAAATMRGLYRPCGTLSKQRRFGMRRTDAKRQRTILLQTSWRARRGQPARTHHEETDSSRRAIVNLCRSPQGPEQHGRAVRRSRLRVEYPALRSGHGRDQAPAYRTTGRDRARADEALLDDRRFLA